MLIRIAKFFEEKFEEILCVAGLITMASCIMLQIILRYFFSKAAPWVDEIAVYAMVMSIYLGASLAIRDRAHMRITVVLSLLPVRLRKIVIIAGDLIWFAFLICLMILSFSWIKLLFEQTYITPGLGIEQRWPQSIVPFALFLMILRMVQVYYRYFKKGEEPLSL
jgi:TRAP-type C4-dicarboxylate transport system permease small subunit